MNWLNGANDEKNRGFYVDIHNGTWTTPAKFTLDKFTQESQYTDTIIKYAIQLYDIGITMQKERQ